MLENAKPLGVLKMLDWVKEGVVLGAKAEVACPKAEPVWPIEGAVDGNERDG